MKLSISRSYRLCERVTSRHAKNFFYGLRLLPREKRQALYAIYAFMRATDDIADDSASSGTTAPAVLEAWKRTLEDAYAGRLEARPTLPAFHDAVQRYHIPRKLFEELIDGVAMDLQPHRFASYDELARYCYLVAGTVGLVCLHVWGVRDWEPAASLAVRCGTAFQLTNILRDLREDALRGRLYLPLEDLDLFGLGQEEVLALRWSDRLEQLLAFEIQRAEALYRECEPLAGWLSPDSRSAFLAMHSIYHALLTRIGRHPVQVLSHRVRVPWLAKLVLVYRAVVSARRMAAQDACTTTE